MGYANQITGVTFGSLDNDSYQYDSSTGRMTQYQFNMGTGPQSQTGALTWNANGTLSKLVLTDQINTANSQTCKYGDPSASVAGYDDLGRIVSANCASAWSQTFAFDPFGNLKKTGSAQFLPTYTGESGAGSPINQYYQISGGGSGTSTYYDANGNLKYDVTHTYTWDADGNMLSTDGTTVTMMYDAMDRMIEQTRGSSHTEIVYGPYGMKLALMNGQTMVNAFVKLPGGSRAVYGSSGLAYYRHSDHLGSSRLATTPSRTKYYDVAYAPYGEDYNGSGTTADLAFTDENQDTVKNGWSSNLFDFMLREYRPAHGRWTSPDPAGLDAVDPTNPQTWNRYAYVLNDPEALVDLLGDTCYQGAWANSMGQDLCNAMGGGYSWRDTGMFLATSSSGKTSAIGIGWNGSSYYYYNASSGAVISPTEEEFPGLPPLPSITAPDNVPVNTGPANGSPGQCPPGNCGGVGVGNVGMCMGPTCSAVHAAQAAGEKLPDPQDLTTWYLCASNPVSNIRNYTLEGTGKGILWGGGAGFFVAGPWGILPGALDGGTEGFIGGVSLGTLAADVCGAAGVYGPQ